jgi:acyl dehydratase
MTDGVAAPSQETGWYIEDFQPGAQVLTMGRTVTETDLVNYLGLSAFFEEVFMNSPMAHAESVYRRRVVPAVLVLAIAEGLFVLTGRLNRGIAFLGMTDLQMKAPVAVGDTLRVRLEVRSTRMTSKPGRGILEVAHAVEADGSRLVMEYVSTRMMQARPLAS